MIISQVVRSKLGGLSCSLFIVVCSFMGVAAVCEGPKGKNEDNKHWKLK